VEKVERLLVVRCPGLLEEHEHGREARTSAAVARTLATFATRVDLVRPGVCAVPTRGPSRYFGGDAALACKADKAVTREIPDLAVGVGIADGLFAALLASCVAAPGGPVVVPPGEASAFLAPWPVSALDRPDLADLLGRLGIRTLGAFAALPGSEVLARFGTDGAICLRVASGIEGELPGLRLFFPDPGAARPRRGPRRRAPTTAPAEDGNPAASRQGGFWGGTAGGDARAARAAADVQALLGPESVVRGRLQGGRGPGQRFRLLPWTGPDDAAPSEPTGAVNDNGPWPGQIPPPAPAVVLAHPLPVQLADTAQRTVGVSASGAVTAPPARLSVAGGAWVGVGQWAGPWPADERWWSVQGRRRRARIQVVTSNGVAHLLACERGTWWLEATYD
jgi:hypothetical protein